MHEGREHRHDHPRARHDRNLFGLAICGFGAVLVFEAITGVDVSVLSVLGAAWFGHMAISKKIWWAWIPFAFLAMDAMADVGRGLFGLVPGDRGIFLPLLVISGGVLLFTRPKRPHPVAIAILAISLIGLATSGRDRDRGALVRDVHRQVATAAIPALGEKTLVVHTTSGSITLERDATLKAPVSADGALRIVARSREVDVSPRNLTNDVRVRIPADVSVRVRTSSGDVEATIEGGELEVDTTSGDVEVDLGATDAVVDISTTDGSVEVAFSGTPDLRVDTRSGDIDVNGYPEGDDDPEGGFRAEGAQGNVTIRTVEGDIDIDRKERSLR